MTDGDGTAAAANAAGQAGDRADSADGRPVSASFGDIVNVLMRTDPFSNHTLADLEWLVLPALRTGQFAVARGNPDPVAAKDPNAPNPNVPIATVLWAYVSDEVSARLESDLSAKSIRLAPDEWRSGSNGWIVAAAGTPDALRATLKQLARQVFPANAPAKILVNKDGTNQVEQLRLSLFEPAAGGTTVNS